MKPRLCQALLVILIAHTGRVAGIRCLECSDRPHPGDCRTITECTDGAECYVEQLITSGGLVLYNTGCMSTKRCAAKKRDLRAHAGTRASRSDSDLITCLDCCKDSFCNMDGCGETSTKQPQRGPVCYDCHSQDGPAICRDVTICGQGQVCLLAKPQPYSTYWHSGCTSQLQCDHLAQVLGANHDTNTCAMCCTTDYCNDHCH